MHFNNQYPHRVLELGLVKRLGAMVARSSAVSLVSTMVLLSQYFSLMVYRVHQSVLGVALVVTARVKHTIRLNGNKELA